ncbi:uncharacterized protein LOC103310300 [Acyrthosiphon pisum]|uniref:Uncharacterized protein n=1 Tax=Acyrthosiphon pisum TaxID=7029 RepID=A0A8R2NX74_ACYPI|nr:uncharacterized protein LOC103310300 [Acyrthosiphon pisum]
MNRDVSQAIGILSTIESTKFIINLFILEEVLQLANILSTKFQQKSVTLGKTVNLIEGMIDTFEQNRSNTTWTELWTKINEFMKENGMSIESSNDAESRGLSPSRPKRLRKEPYHLNTYVVTCTTSAETEQISTFDNDIKNIWKVKYFNILDAIMINMKKRFSPESLQMAMAIDSFTKLNFDKSSFFIDNYKVTIRIFK